MLKIFEENSGVKESKSRIPKRKNKNRCRRSSYNQYTAMLKGSWKDRRERNGTTEVRFLFVDAFIVAKGMPKKS